MLSGVLVLIAACWAAPAAGHGEISDSIRELDTAIEAQPDDGSLVLRRGELHRLHRDFERAIADFAKAEKLGADPREAALYHGRALFEAGRSEDALVPLARAIALEPENSRAWTLRGRALADLGQPTRAAAAFGRAIAAQASPDPDLYLSRAVALREAGDPEAALAGLDEGVARLGPLVVFQQPALELELGLGRVDAALVRLDSVVAQAAWPTPWLVRRAEILAGAGRSTEARRLLADARSKLATRKRPTPQLEARIDRALAALPEEP